MLPQGSVLFALQCQEAPGGAAPPGFGTPQWPNCYTEPVCDSLPDPDAASLLVRATADTKVRLGQEVIYQCKDKDRFFETPEAS